ncbi:hypothetical protein Glov_2253 [Trichlorobacter lovleyi SZ]|uniref:Uncharacterized protein n=1 Tax=Trichlorobacter lovleyi (strain ATCC BAA-1151 / DSM 17278 / SZ) TaxID=398767 RepID=B3E4N3_TRIL1|nr:hypothetical protein Glov_2253 [Trichlorobacter lovleyi SZ]
MSWEPKSVRNKKEIKITLKQCHLFSLFAFIWTVIYLLIFVLSVSSKIEVTHGAPFTSPETSFTIMKFVFFGTVILLVYNAIYCWVKYYKNESYVTYAGSSSLVLKQVRPVVGIVVSVFVTLISIEYYMYTGDFTGFFITVISPMLLLLTSIIVLLKRLSSNSTVNSSPP